MSPVPPPLVAVLAATAVSAAAAAVHVAPTQTLAPGRLPLVARPVAAVAVEVTAPTPLVEAVGRRSSPVSSPPTPSGRTARAGGDGWRAPVSPPDVVRPFDAPSHPWLPGHRGVDLAAPVGAAVTSPTAGRVTYADRLAGRGVVVVTHAGGLRSTLEPVRAAVPVGAVVATGEVVGAVEDRSDHCAPERCLHWGVLRGREYLDPLSLLGTTRVVLLPLG